MLFENIRREKEKTYFFTGKQSAQYVAKAFIKHSISDFEIWEHDEALKKLPVGVVMPEYVRVGSKGIKTVYSDNEISVVVSNFNTNDMMKNIERLEHEGMELSEEQIKIIKKMYRDSENGTLIQKLVKESTDIPIERR